MIYVVVIILVGAACLGIFQFLRLRSTGHQWRSDPERLRALTEPVSYRVPVWVRYRHPRDRWPSNRWSPRPMNPMELVVRANSAQVSTTALADLNRATGWYFCSPETTMRQDRMLFLPSGNRDCIVLAGSFLNKDVELAIYPLEGGIQALWDALAASGVVRVA